MAIRYFVHPESACAWKFEMTDEQFQTYMSKVDPLVQEVDEQEYYKACSAFGEQDELLPYEPR